MNHVSPSLAERRAYAVPRGIASTHRSIVVERALGAQVWDTAGRAYLDFTAGIAVCNVGHCHPRVVDAAARQIATAIHTCFNVAPSKAISRSPNGLTRWRQAISRRRHSSYPRGPRRWRTR